MNVTKIVLPPEFISTVTKAKQKRAVINNLQREIEYEKSQLRYFAESVYFFPGVCLKRMDAYFKFKCREIKHLRSELRGLMQPA